MRVLFCGGGTAGHVNPALAVAQTVMRNSADNRVAYITTLGGIENNLVDFKKYPIDVVGLKRGLSIKNLSFLKKQIQATERCKSIIREFRPDIVFGTGGYATSPVILAARKLGVKTLIHESNAVPGKAIKFLEKKADRVLVNFRESEKYFKCKEKIVHTGNPLRKSIEIGKKEARSILKIKAKYVILCTGGSLGSERINLAAAELLDNYLRDREDIQFYWSTGKNEYEKVNRLLKSRGLWSIENAIIKDYFTDLPVIMSASDLVISRAGAVTISELSYLNKASILVPSPNVTNNHQLKNAQALEKSGSAVLLTENRLYTLIDTVKELLNSEHKRAEMEKSIKQYAIEDANKIIYNLFLEMLHL